MNLDNIRTLAGIVTANGLTALEVSEGGTCIRLERNHGGVQSAVSASAGTPVSGVEELVSAKSGHFDEVKSPMVGVFYSAPSPDSEPFVSIGSRIKKGDVLCIVEAMKLMNEITAEQDGEVADVCVKNGDIVEYGQTLFKLM